MVQLLKEIYEDLASYPHIVSNTPHVSQASIGKWWHQILANLINQYVSNVIIIHIRVCEMVNIKTRIKGWNHSFTQTMLGDFQAQPKCKQFKDIILSLMLPKFINQKFHRHFLILTLPTVPTNHYSESSCLLLFKEKL